MRAMLLVRRGGALTPALSDAIRDKGFEPFVLSSRTYDDGSRFHGMCDDIDVQHAISPNVGLTVDEVVARARAIEDCAFAITMADSQRVPMAAANAVLGAHDITPSAATLALDKHLMRAKLVSCGLSALTPLRLPDPELLDRLERGERFIIKPRRGVSSLCIGIATSWADIPPMRAAFAVGPGDHDMLEEYFTGNELVAETFFDGEELSIDVIRQAGVNRISVAHGKAGLEYRNGTVLELGHVSPPVNLAPGQLEAATAFVDEAMVALELTDGCYHVEVRVNAADECELIEVNPRVPGHLLWDSIRLQHDRSIIDDWIDVLAGNEVGDPGEPLCGTYMEVAYPDEGVGQLVGVRPNPKFPQPAVDSNDVVPGMPEIAHREEPAMIAVWTTDRARHAEDVRFLMSEQYAQFVYAKPVTRPVAVLLQPTDGSYAGLSDVDVLIFVVGKMTSTEAYTAVMDQVCGIHPVESWSDVDTVVSQILLVLGRTSVASVVAGAGDTAGVADALRAKLAPA